MPFKPYGIIPATVTPLTENEQIDQAALRRLVNHLIAGASTDYLRLAAKEKRTR